MIIGGVQEPTLVGMPARSALLSPSTPLLLEITKTISVPMCRAGSLVASMRACKTNKQIFRRTRNTLSQTKTGHTFIGSLSFHLLPPVFHLSRSARRTAIDLTSPNLRVGSKAWSQAGRKESLASGQVSYLALQRHLV